MLDFTGHNWFQKLADEIDRVGSNSSDTHFLKTVDPWFCHVFTGQKTFEVRYDDRGYSVGDVLVLRHFISYEPMLFGQLGIIATARYVTGHPLLPKGNVIISIDVKSRFLLGEHTRSKEVLV